LSDLELPRQGRQIAHAVPGAGAPVANIEYLTRLLNREINASLGIGSKARQTLSADQAESAMADLDTYGDAVRDRISSALTEGGQ
jgi:hypothetical protein